MANLFKLQTKVKAIDVDTVQTLKEYLEKCEEESPVGKLPGVPCK